MARSAFELGVIAVSTKESNRQYRVLDQTLTAHSILRDRYGKWSLCLTVGLLALAVVLNAFVFASDEVFTLFGGDPGDVRLWLGMVSVAILILSIADFKVDWQGRAKLHQDAVRRLRNLKAEFRSARARSKDDISDELIEGLSQGYAKVMEELPPIPENEFVRLKVQHLRKVRLSREVDNWPGVPLVFRRCYNCFRDSRAWLLSSKRKGTADPDREEDA